MSPGPAQPRSREPRQVRKEAAVNGVRVCRRGARVYEPFYILQLRRSTTKLKKLMEQH
jgi:hypothetical protein